jgi:hypothetical protein
LETRRVVSTAAAQRASPRWRRASCRDEHSRNVSGIGIYATLSITHNEHSQCRLRVGAAGGVASPRTRACTMWAGKIWNRRYISVSTCDEQSHDLPPAPVPLVATGSVDGKLTIAPAAADGVVAAGGRTLPAAPSLTAAAHLLTRATRSHILMNP